MASATDRVAAPVPRQTVLSPNGAFALDIERAAQWRTDPPTGTLRAASAAGGPPLWRRTLPQPVLPRFALVADDGTVALFDQWENTRPAIAVLLIDRRGGEIARIGFEDIERTLGIPGRMIVPQARHGIWIATPPTLAGTRARVGVAGRVLSIDLGSGRMTVE